MIAILTEKPSVGLDIARIVGATQKNDGYMEGSGYMVTWALGHLVSLALPEQYSFTRSSASSLPILPSPFQLVVRQKKTAKGMVADKAAAKQLNIIDRVFNQCDSIIAATDAAREGEAIFRYIYTHLGYTKPFKRLWISSLTDEAIRKGLANLKEGSEYDGLYRAADCRAKADWLIGMNASRALAVSSGTGNNSLGRVQTPTLVMICARYHENRNFISANYWQLYITLEKEGEFRRFRFVEDLKEKTKAENLYKHLKTFPSARITKVERKTVHQAQPLLYDLTTLQKECNIHLDLPAEKTLEIAQSLYEKKLVSYPRTSSRYVPEDVFREIPSLLRVVLRMDKFKHFANGIDVLRLAKRSVNDKKITDHHALIITGEYPEEISALERKVYHMIAGRMLEAFGPKCEKETLLMEVSLGDLLFCSRSQKILSAGWRGVFGRPEDKEADEKGSDEGMAEFEEEENGKVGGHSLVQKKTMPKPLYTEATLLTAMEAAGKTITDEAAREAMKDQGLGTPATRAAIIETLFKREYIERAGKLLVPTGKGLSLFDAVKDMKVADAEMTGGWEKALTDIEKNAGSPDTFMKAIEVYTRQVTEEVLSLKFPELAANSTLCPKCGTGRVVVRSKHAKCDNEKCGLLIFRKCLNKELTDQHIGQLLSSGSTELIKGFKNKKGNTFDAKLVFDSDHNITFSFSKTTEKGKRKRKQ
ncbi:type IA DNA topoisomerase [Bacteroides sp. 51]|uniref:type IA DNA topoisomerase n=1 Tax=Bacteroides sp. 51 TaxID=2302938 RepID=UPI0013D8B3C6|nr:type IA DNA topoisomerase [Bacteroides sp. 51]NDV81557.1 type IA DNA topoisomerase [Bacteroides sp. 51]